MDHREFTAHWPLWVIFLIGPALLGACGKPVPPPAPVVARKVQVARVVAIIQRCPDWHGLVASSDPSATRKRIMECLKEVNGYETAILREAVKELLKMDRRYDMSNRIYVLNRYIFQVPPRGPNGESYSYGYFAPQGPRDASALWPLSLNDKGDLELTGTFSGYMGVPYEAHALRQFDYFHAHFGRRQFPPAPNPSPT